MRDQWIRESEFIVCMYAINDKASFDYIRELVEEVKRVKETDVPIMAVGNKMDDENHREVTIQDAIQLFDKELEIPFMEVSAKTNTGIFIFFYCSHVMNMVHRNHADV